MVTDSGWMVTDSGWREIGGAWTATEGFDGNQSGPWGRSLMHTKSIDVLEDPPGGKVRYQKGGGGGRRRMPVLCVPVMDTVSLVQLGKENQWTCLCPPSFPINNPTTLDPPS